MGEARKKKKKKSEREKKNRYFVNNDCSWIKRGTGSEIHVTQSPLNQVNTVKLYDFESWE